MRKPMSFPSVVLLDAMGVLYESADDVAELLVPFVMARSPATSVGAIQDAYRRASIGEYDAAGFWAQVGLPESMEDEYLEGHKLQAGLPAFLDYLEAQQVRVACLSNDVARWSVKLRRKFGIEDRFERWFISGELGWRKPDSRIYAAAINALGIDAAHILFVDDRQANVDAAEGAGLQALRFGSGQTAGQAVGGFHDLTRWLRGEGDGPLL
ncbi:HAD family hydrolase [Pseudoduganella lutea]|nr:HAD-IA family hydrolase [Pseudoduganella lutea]